MITEIPLATLLSIIWAVVFVMAACGLSYWAAHLRDARSEVLNALMRPKDAPTRRKLAGSKTGRGDASAWKGR
jgi:hypothetical protein